MPELIGLYNDHLDHRGTFEVLAIHDKSVKTFAELDQKLPPLKELYWQGRDLPFPVLLDATGATEKLFGVSGHPTSLLIDPDGKLVGAMHAADLEKKLPPVSAAKRWARHRAMSKAGFWSFEPARDTLKTLAETFQRRTGDTPIDLDPAALTAAGLTPDGPLPGLVAGGMPGVTIASIESLLLAPHGLAVVPDANGKRLRITTRPAGYVDPPPTVSQVRREKDLSTRLDTKPGPGDGFGKAKPLKLDNVPLAEAVKLVGREYDLPVALDARAMLTKKLDPAAKVTGSVGPADLRIGLAKLIAPLGLTVVVRHEVVLVTVK